MVKALTKKKAAVHSHPSQEMIDFILKYSKGSVSFLTLYPDYIYFRRIIRGFVGVIAYMESTTAWVGAAEPVCEDDSILEELVEEFFDEAKKSNKTAMIIPVGKNTAERIRKKGKFALQIGSEIWISLINTVELVPLAKQFSAKGAKVEAFDPAKINAREHVEIEEVTKSWLGSRNTGEIGFLNRLAPWALLEHKKYFRVTYNSQLMGYLAAVPTRGKKSWYLADLIRAQKAPLGTTELLVCEAMTQLRRENSDEVTLGMVSLAGIDQEERKVHPITYRIFNYLFHQTEMFFKFKSLYLYKDKYQPNRWEPTYIIASTPRLGIMSYYSLIRVLLPGGVLPALLTSIQGLFEKIHFKKLFEKLFTPSIVVRGAPLSFFEFVFRVKSTLILIGVNLLFFWVANVSNGGNLQARFVDEFAYQWKNLMQKGVCLESIQTLILPSFLHWNWLHLLSNLAATITLVTALELVAGSSIVCIAYLLGALLSNPLTSMAILPILYLFSPESAGHFSETLDVGNSLGIFACLGAIGYLFKHSKTFLFLLTLGTGIATYIQSDLLMLNHVTSIIIGYLFIRFMLPKTIN